MKLCISTLSCPNWNLQQMIDACAASGIDGIDFRGIGEEIDVTKSPLFTSEIDATLNLLRSNNIAMPCLNTSVTLVSPSPQRWQMMLEETQRYAQLAERTRTPWLRVFGGRVPREITRNEARVLAVRHLRQIIKIARTHGCQPLVETHDDWATSGEMLELLHEFGPTDVGVLWDIEHPFRKGESPADTASRLRKYIRHVHVKDSRSDPDGSTITPTLLGDGDLPLSDVARVSREIGYDGWVCLETEKRWHAIAPEPELSVPQFAKFMNGSWLNA
jgi:sugar phosphate isomerase/epimerase